MNYAYIVCSDIYCNQAEMVLKTLDRHCNCIVLLNVYNPPKEFIGNLSKWFKQKYIIYDIPKEEWINKRMFSKIKRLLKMNFECDDNVSVMDTDLFVQEDIFKIFETDFDIYYTTRGYKQDVPAPINAGFWGFKFNDRSKKFLKFYIEQMCEPSWAPYIKFEESMLPLNRKILAGRLDWWCDQDFLNAVYLNNNKVPFECKIIDIGPEYNFTHATINLIGNRNYKVLHFKGARKNAIKDILKGRGIK